MADDLPVTASPVDTSQPRLARPIIILGAPRSGTSLLSWILQGHGALALFEEPRLTWKYGNDAKSDMLRGDDARPEVVRHIRDAFNRRMIESGRRRMAEKTPSNALRLDFVNAVFPDARFVHIMRHGVDSVLSIESYWGRHATGMGGKSARRLRERLGELNLARLPHYGMEMLRRLAPAPLKPLVGQNIWGPRLPGIRGMLKEMDTLEIACLQWRMCVETACRQGRRLSPDRYREWRLEDMSRDLIRSVLEFCELEEDPGVWAQFESRYDPALNQDRKRAAPGQRTERILDLIAPTLDWLGYGRGGG